MYQEAADGMRGFEDAYTSAYQPPRASDYYDIDQGSKSSMARDIARSVRRYAIMQSNVPRFQGKFEYKAPAVNYNVDHMHKRTVATTSLHSPRKYAATFSGSQRWGKDTYSEAPDITYDTDSLSKRTMYTAVMQHPRSYANMRSRAPRFTRKASEVMDIMYDTDTLGKASFASAVAASQRKYAVLQSRTDRWPKATEQGAGALLGPGAYDTPCAMDLRKDWAQRPLSSFQSKANRLNAKRDPSKNLGGTWTLNSDTQVWHGPHFKNKWNPTKYTRPSYLPSAYDEK